MVALPGRHSASVAQVEITEHLYSLQKGFSLHQKPHIALVKVQYYTQGSAHDLNLTPMGSGS